jgi:hypothetical protein
MDYESSNSSYPVPNTAVELAVDAPEEYMTAPMAKSGLSAYTSEMLLMRQR